MNQLSDDFPHELDGIRSAESIAVLRRVPPIENG